MFAEVGAFGTPAIWDAGDEGEDAGDKCGHAFCHGSGKDVLSSAGVEWRVVVGDEDRVDVVKFTERAFEVASVVAADADVTAEAAGFGVSQELDGGGVGEVDGGNEVEEFARAERRAVMPPGVPVGLVDLQEVDVISP